MIRKDLKRFGSPRLPTRTALQLCRDILTSRWRLGSPQLKKKTQKMEENIKISRKMMGLREKRYICSASKIIWCHFLGVQSLDLRGNNRKTWLLLQFWVVNPALARQERACVDGWVPRFWIHPRIIL